MRGKNVTNEFTHYLLGCDQDLVIQYSYLIDFPFKVKEILQISNIRNMYIISARYFYFCHSPGVR